ncbi:tetratricopeptide repeat protein [Streptomyces sp. NPDC053499]|uniref:tetratricopeptide repeat protein n=1 Tax=Streptomyces sp. NPDC053499 TaxID=3365707 RepID=UPI0037D0FDCE
MEFAQNLSKRSVEGYVSEVSGKLGCTNEQAESFLLALRIEYGIPDRVTLRAHHIVNTVGKALEAASLSEMAASDAWDAVVSLVASKSRDLDTRDFSSIDLASPDALDADSLTSAKIARRTIRRNDVLVALSSTRDDAVNYPIASNLWMREPSTTFVGREDLLYKVSEHCESDSQAKPAIAILGMSGVGKSEILTQYAWKHAEAYAFVWWVRGDSWNSMVADLAVLTERLGLPAPDSDDGLRQLKQYLLHNRGLVLLDGAKAEDQIVSFIPKISATRFLISSLDQGWAAHMPAIQVVPLVDEDANTLLASILVGASNDRLATLNQALNGLPLALKQAAGYISGSGIPIETYSEMIRDRASELLRRSAPPEHVGLTAALSITLERLSLDQPNALKLLHMLAYMAPHGFPTELFGFELPAREGGRPIGGSDQGTVDVERLASEELESISSSAVRLLAELKDHLSLYDAVADLQRFSLIDAQPGGISCHALTQAVVRQSVAEQERQSAIEAGVFLLNKVANLRPFDSRYWPHYRHMLPHFESLLRNLESRRFLPSNTLMFYSVISMTLGSQGAKESSLSYAEKAVTATERMSDVSEEIIVFVRTLLVEALTGADRWDDALHVANAALEIAQSGQLDSFSAGALHTKKAAVLHLQGKLEEAMVEFDRAHACIEFDADREGSDSIKRAVKSNKAAIRREIGDTKGAIEEFKQLIEDYPEKASRNGLATLYSNLALSYLDATEFANALHASKKALDIDYESADGIHADAARDWNNAGLALLELGKSREAADAFNASLRTHERISNRESTVYLIARMNLGRAQMAQNNFVIARETLENTLKGQEAVLGSHHRDIAATLANLSVVYSALRLFGDAASAALRAIKIDVQVYGEGHPELMPDYNNMASALMLSGSYRASLKWLNKAYDIATRTFGEKHVRAGMCLEKIGICKYSDGEISAGIKAMRTAIEIFNSKLGPEHPETQSCRWILSEMLLGKQPLSLVGKPS